MPGNLVQADRVDDDFLLGDTHRQHLADMGPRHRVEVQAVGDEALDVDMAVHDQGRVEVAGGQRQQLRLLALMPLQRRFVKVTQAADVGNVVQPPRRHFVEMFQGIKGAAVEQIGFDVVELALDLPLGLRPAHAAGLRFEAVVRGEGQELGVVQRAVGVVPEHHGLEVVVQADAGHAAQMMERVYVLAQGGRQIHRLDKAQILPS